MGSVRPLLVALSVLTSCTPVPIGQLTPPATPSGRPGEPVATATPILAPRTPRPEFWVEAPSAGDPSPVYGQIPETGVALESGRVRLLRPPITQSPRRIAIQAGHWKVTEAPLEFPNLRFSGGGSVSGVNEVDITLDIAQRVVAGLMERGYAVDLLPATVPPSYLADVFVALHADSDLTGTAGGFKAANGTYRSPYDDLLTRTIIERYQAGTGLPQNERVTVGMTDYYAFAWFRYVHALAPHTPATILEMGFISHPTDRDMMLSEQDRVASAIVDGIVRFLDAVPRSTLFAEDIVVPTVTAPPATPTASP